MLQDTRRHYRPCGSGLQWKQFKRHYRPCIKYRAPRKQNGPCSTGLQRTLRDTFSTLCETLLKPHFCVHLESSNTNFSEIGKYPEIVIWIPNTPLHCLRVEGLGLGLESNLASALFCPLGIFVWPSPTVLESLLTNIDIFDIGSLL